jgi:hypothetical protein
LSALYYGMKVNEFYSLRISEINDFIEAKSRRIKDENDLLIKVGNMYFGQLCATIANFSGSKKRWKSTDFFKGEKRKQTAEEQAHYLIALTQQLGGTVEGW